MENDKRSLRGKVIWLFGISCTGKTTLADFLAKDLKDKGQMVVRLDGDIVRKSLCMDLGFSKGDIFENIRRVCFVADLLSRNGITVIASFITPHRVNRLYLKRKLGKRLILVHVLTSLRVCMERDTKGLYEKVLSGEITNVAGLDAPFHPVDHLTGLTIVCPTSYFSAEDSYDTLTGLLGFWGYEV